MDFDFNKVQKVFSEGLILGFGKEHFTIGIVSGVNVTSFVVTPSQMKLNLIQIEKTIAQYEKLYNKKIESPPSSGIQSPIQLDNLSSKKPPESDTSSDKRKK